MHCFIPYFVFLFFFLTSCKQIDQTNISIQLEKDKLISQLNEFNTAFRDGDIIKLENSITDNYLHTNSQSKAIRKSDWFVYLKKRKKELESGELIIKDYEMSEVETEIYNNTAIVTAKISFASIRSKEYKENEFRITTVWVNDGKDWKRAGFHDTRIK